MAYVAARGIYVAAGAFGPLHELLIIAVCSVYGNEPEKDNIYVPLLASGYFLFFIKLRADKAFCGGMPYAPGSVENSVYCAGGRL